jgi:hypothetical protein
MNHENKNLNPRKRKTETKSERRKKLPDSKDSSPDRLIWSTNRSNFLRA